MGSGELAISDENFDIEVINSSLPVMVDFWAEWCGPCRIIGPVVEELAKEYVGKLKVKKLNVDSNPNTPSRYNVLNIPTLIFFKKGEEVERVVGVVSKKELIKKTEEVIGD